VKKQYAKVLKEEGMESSRLGDGSRRRGERGEHQDGAVKGRRKGKERPVDGEKDVEKPHERRTRPTRALSPSDVGPPLPQTSLRELKKQAFARYQPLRTGDAGDGLRGERGKGQPDMGARMGVLLERIKRDKAG